MMINGYLVGGDWNHGIFLVNLWLMVNNWNNNISGWWFGTMEIYEFPFSWEWKIIPTDELHDFLEG